MYHVLVAEDELWIRSAIVEMVERIGNGFEVVGEAANGEEAWDYIQQLWPTVLITDIMMPKRDGLWLVQQISAQRLPIVTIVISGYDNFQYAQKAIRHGVSEYMLKPVMEEELKNALERSLHRLENVKEMNHYLLEIQDYIDNLQHMDQNMIMEKQTKIVESILKRKLLHPGARKSLFRIFSGKISELLEEDGNSKIINDDQDEDFVRQHFRSRLERLINKNYQYSDYNVKLVIKQVCEKIKENYMNDITLAEMADYSNLSTSYFSTLFKQYTGLSFVNYVNQTRIDRSKLLLMEADIRIYDVADMVGFSSLPYFNRVFKKEVGKSPNEYRKSLGIC